MSRLSAETTEESVSVRSMVPADRVSEISLGDEFRNREGDPSAVHRHALSAYRNFRRFCVREHAALHYRRTSGDVSGSFARLASPARETAIPSDLRCFIIHAPSSQTEICLSSSHRSGMALPGAWKAERSSVCALCNDSAEVAR